MRTILICMILLLLMIFHASATSTANGGHMHDDDSALEEEGEGEEEEEEEGLDDQDDDSNVHTVIPDDLDMSSSSMVLPVRVPVVPESVEERREHYRAMVAKDLLRQRWLTEQRGGGGRRQASESEPEPEPMSDDETSMFEMPMQSGMTLTHVGVYLVTVLIGTPEKPYSMALDLANDLTWVNCRLRRRKGKHPGRPKVKSLPQLVKTRSVNSDGTAVKVLKNFYRPALSSSWRRYRCPQPVCQSLKINTCSMDPATMNNHSVSCTYIVRMNDDTVSSGIFGQEAASAPLYTGQMAKLPGIYLGCSTAESGIATDTHDGILALGNSNVSFVQTAITQFGGRFSYCLLAPDTSSNTSSYLTFGSNPTVKLPGTLSTNLLLSSQYPAYSVIIDGIFINGKKLDIPPDAWDLGVIVDTGTSITTLSMPAYYLVTRTLHSLLTPHLTRLPPKRSIAFQYCYRWSYDDANKIRNFTVPSFAIEFGGGARFAPDPKTYLMPEAEPEVACLAFIPAYTGPSILANVLMQEHIWEFDFVNEMLRFRKDKCIDGGNVKTQSLQRQS